MDTTEALQRKIDAAVKAGNKQVANQLRQKLQKMEREANSPSKGPGNRNRPPKSRNRPGPGGSNTAQESGTNRTKGNPKGYLTDVRAYEIPGKITVTGNEAYPKAREYPTPSGRSIGTEPIRSYYQTDLPQVWIPQQSVISLLSGPEAPGFLQIGNVADASVSGSLNLEANSLYYKITRALSSVGGPVNFDLTIAAADATHFLAMTYYMYQYSQAYCIVRSALAMLSAGNLNSATGKLAAAVMINYQQLLTWMIELRTYPMCQGWCDVLDAWTGAFLGGKDDPVIFGGVVQNVPVDLTVAANMLNYINGAGVFLGALANPNPALVDVPSMLKVQRVMSIAYGSPTYSDDKPVIDDPCAYATLKAQAVTFHDTTDAVTFSWPNYNNTQDPTIIPIMVPSGYEGPYLRYVSSFLRPVVYSADAVAGNVDTNIANQVGLFSNVTTNFTQAIWYDQLAGYHVSSSQQAGFYAYSYEDVETELEFWLSEAGLHVTNYTTDHRSFAGIDIAWTSNQILSTETVWLLVDIFLNPLSKGKEAINVER